VIRVEHVTKYYGKRLAVDDISFSVERGEIVGFLGPNGAGKTTTMRMISGYLIPTRGEVRVAGHNIVEQPLEGRRLLGYLPEALPLYTDMTTRAYLKFAARLRGMDRGRINARIDAVVEMCHIEDYIDVIIGKLSRGFRQRVGLAQAIIHEPQVLILDEPTIGIDPRQVVETKQLIKKIGEDHAVLLSSHILPEVSTICGRVIVIHQGKIVAQDRIEKLASVLGGGGRIRLKVQGPPEKVTSCLERVEGITGVRYDEPYHVVDFLKHLEPRVHITEAIAARDWVLLTMDTVEMSLEDIFMQLTSTKEAGD
jgi:ABC-2 type transport system ATP-binding protein